jgi:hypothetical protein
MQFHRAHHRRRLFLRRRRRSRLIDRMIQRVAAEDFRASTLWLDKPEESSQGL